MNIVLFKDVTTEDILTDLETEAKKYAGLYVDMENAPERKYVKDKAALVAGMLKTLDRARIDKSKQYKNSVEAEALEIKQRLQAVNAPFQVLIDDHKQKRDKILAEEKRLADEERERLSKEADHEAALMMDKIYLHEKADREREQKERDDEIRRQAAIQAERDIDRKITIEAERVKRDKEARENNVRHLASVNNEILAVLIRNSISEHDAKKMIKLAARGSLPNLTINY